MRCREWRPSPPADRSCVAVLLTWAVAEGARSPPIPDPSCHSDTGQTCACGRGEWSRPRPSDPPPPDRTGESQPTDITQILFGPALILQLSLVASDSSYLWDDCVEVSHVGRLGKRPCLA